MPEPSERYSTFDDIADKVSRTNKCSKNLVFNRLNSDLWDRKFAPQNLRWYERRASNRLFPGEPHFDTPLPPVYNAEKGANDHAIPLEPDESISKLDELTTESLVRRANAISGGKRLTVSSGKDALVQFLLTGEVKKQEAETVFVTDSTATPGYPTRTHEIIVNGNNVQYEFQHGKSCEMPYAHGMKFLGIESFEVKHRDGTRIPTLPNVAERANGQQPPKLRPDEVIAKFDELSEEALIRRSNAIPGGERFTGQSDRDALIGFLLDRGRNEQAPAAGTKSVPVKPAGPKDAAGFTEGGQWTEKDVSKFFEDTTEGAELKQHSACPDYPEKTTLKELFGHLSTIGEPLVFDAFDEADKPNFRRLAIVEFCDFTAKSKTVLKNVAIPDDEVCRFCDRNDYEPPKSYAQELTPETQPPVSPHEVPSPHSPGRPTYRPEIEAAYKALRDAKEIDFDAPKNKLYEPIRKKVRAHKNDPSLEKGLQDEAIRKVIYQLFETDKSARPTSP